jgi:O-antigen/teichoic acid export membrane protein
VLRPLLAYGIWAAGIASVWQLLSYYPTWHLLRVTDESVVGAFYAVRMITQLVQIAGAVGVSIVAAHVTRLWEAEGAARALPFLETLTKAGTVGLIVIAAGLAVAEPLVMKLLPARLSSGAIAYHPMLGFFLLFSITSLWAIRLSLIERPRLVFVAWSIGAAVGVAVCFLSLGSPFSVERTDPAAALSRAAWALTAGGGTALLVLLVMSIREKTAPGGASIILGILSATVLAGAWPALACGLLVLGASFLTPLILGGEERRALRALLPTRKGR